MPEQVSSSGGATRPLFLISAMADYQITLLNPREGLNSTIECADNQTIF
jgi:hypothetical protein